MTTNQRIDGGNEPGMEQDAPRKVALIANCLLNQNAKVCEGGRPNRPEDDWEIVPRRGVWIEELEAELARRGLPPLPATGWALDMGRLDEAGSRRDLEQFLDSREIAEGSRGDDSAAP